MRTLLIVFAVVVVVGAAVLVGSSVQWQDDTAQDRLGPSEAQQNRAEEQVVQKSAPPEQLSETQIRRYQEQLDEATQRSLVAGQMATPGRPTEGESIPGGTAPGGSPR
jgi:hypothetical protein